MPHDQEEQPMTPLGSTNGTLDLKADLQGDNNGTTESDPCLDRKDPVPNNSVFFEKYLQRAQEKTGLDRKWLWIVIGLCLSVVLLFLVVVGLSSAWPAVPHMFRYPICRDAGCLRAASQIQEDLNMSVSPCTSLWGAFCSSWLSATVRPPDRPTWSLKEKLILKDSERIRDLITTLELPLSPETVEWKLRTFYESCLDVGILNSEGTRPLTSMITELGGWLVTKDWILEDFVAMDVLRKLQVGYGVSPFFRIHVEPDPRSPDSYAIRISPSGLGLPDREYYYRDRDDPIRVAYIEYITDVAVYFGRTRNEASKFAEDIFGYEKRIAEVTPSSASLRNPITTYHGITLFELKDTVMIPFHDILQSMYPDANISIDTDVILTSYEYLSEISQIIASTDSRTLNKYLIWTLVQKYIPFLNETYSSTLTSFRSALLGISRPLKRWEYCINLVKAHMGLAVEYLMEKTYPIDEDKRHFISEMFNSTLTVVKDKMKAFQTSPLLYQQLQNKINTVTLHVGLPSNTRNLTFVKSYFLTLKIIKFNFFRSVVNAMTFHKKLEERMLAKSLAEGAFLRLYLKQAPAVTYMGSQNEIIVPRVLLTEPFFDAAFPTAINYGRIGQEVAQALISSILPYGSIWTSEQKILSPFHATVNASFKTTESATTCLGKYLLNLYLDVPVYLANETALSIVTEISAVNAARETLSRTLDRENHSHQGGLESYENEALFFISYSQTRCSDSTSQYHYLENVKNFRLSQKDLLHIVWSQLSSFQQIFECRPDKKVQCPGVL